MVTEKLEFIKYLDEAGLSATDIEQLQLWCKEAKGSPAPAKTTINVKVDGIISPDNLQKIIEEEIIPEIEKFSARDFVLNLDTSSPIFSGLTLSESILVNNILRCLAAQPTERALKIMESTLLLVRNHKFSTI